MQFESRHYFRSQIHSILDQSSILGQKFHFGSKIPFWIWFLFLSGIHLKSEIILDQRFIPLVWIRYIKYVLYQLFASQDKITQFSRLGPWPMMNWVDRPPPTHYLSVPRCKIYDTITIAKDDNATRKTLCKQLP